MKFKFFLIFALFFFLISCQRSTQPSNQGAEQAESSKESIDVEITKSDVSSKSSTEALALENSQEATPPPAAEPEQSAEDESLENSPESNQRLIQIPTLPMQAFAKEGLKRDRKHVKLKQIKRESSAWLDPTFWLFDNGLQPMTLPRRDGDYTLSGVQLNSELHFEPYGLEVTGPGQKETLYDFSQPLTGNGFMPYINHAAIKDEIIYIQFSHRTYSDINPNTAFLIAMDREGNFLWRSKNLIGNTINFCIVGNTIITGYGFTGESDYLYTLDANTGSVVDKIPLRSAPDHLIIKDDELYVSTYNTAYVFSVK